MRLRAGLLSLLVVCVLATREQPAAASSSVGTVKFILKGLSLQPANKPMRHATIHDALATADLLRTVAAQKAELGFVDGTSLYMNQRTNLEVRSANITRVNAGEVHVVDVPGSHHQVQTATAAASAVGTNFDVFITAKAGSGYGKPSDKRATMPAGTTTVSVVLGSVGVSNKHGRVVVHAGQWTFVVPGKAPTKPTAHHARDDIKWTNGLP